MKKNVWIFNHYAADTYFDNGGRHYWFAKYLKTNGYSPTVFVANSIHGASGEKTHYFSNDGLYSLHNQANIDVPYVFVSARGYSGNGRSRILNMLDYFFNVIKTAKSLYKKNKTKPDIIIASSVHPLTLLAGLRLGKYFKIPCVCEVRDLWPESIVAYSSKWKKKNLIIRILYFAEKHIYKSCDALIFTMEGGYKYIEDQGWTSLVKKEKVYCLNNGIDLEEYRVSISEFGSSAHNRELNKEFFNVIYTGSIRAVNDIGYFLDVAKALTNKNIIINIFGNGDEREVLERRLHDEGIENVRFQGVVPKLEIPAILSNGDLLVFHLKPSTVQKYGLSLNKMFEYLASEKPILIDCAAEYNPIVKWRAGISIEGATPEVFASEIDKFSNMESEEYNEYCENARKAAEHYDFKELTNRLIDIIENTNI